MKLEVYPSGLPVPFLTVLLHSTARMVHVVRVLNVKAVTGQVEDSVWVREGPCKHAASCQYWACTGPMLAASNQYRPGTGY